MFERLYKCEDCYPPAYLHTAISEDHKLRASLVYNTSSRKSAEISNIKLTHSVHKFRHHRIHLSTLNKMIQVDYFGILESFMIHYTICLRMGVVTDFCASHTTQEVVVLCFIQHCNLYKMESNRMDSQAQPFQTLFKSTFYF